MGVPIPISDGPILISRSVAKPYLVYNTGTNIVYLGTDSSVSPTAFAFPLAPGAAFQWTEITTDVYAVAAEGKSSTLVVAPEASALALGTVSAAIEGPVDVSGSNVGVSGSVDASGSTIKSRQQNNPVILATSNNPIPNSMILPNGLVNLPAQATAGFSSIIISVGDNAPGIPLGPTNMVEVLVQQTLNGSHVGPIISAHYLLGACSGYVQVPVVGETILVSGQFINTSTGGGGLSSLGVQVIGSSEVITTPRYLSSNFSAKGSLASGGYYNVSAGAVVQDYVTCRNGPAELTVLASSGTSAGSANIAVADFDVPGGPVILAGTGGIPTGGAVTVPINVPMRPVYVTTRPTAGALLCSLLQ